MAGDPSRRPSNAKVRLLAIDAVVWIECGSCFGDGWSWPYRGRPTRKVTCVACTGRGKLQVLALNRNPNDRIVAPPAGWSASTGGE